jgi:hypothetical protein
MVVADNITEIGQGYHAVYHNIQVRRAYGYGVITGGGVTPGSDGGVSVDVASGTALYNGEEQSIPSQSSLSLTSPDSTDPRKDLIVYSGGGTVQAITGTPNPVDSAQSSATRFETYQPSPPDGTGGDYVVLAEVWVAAGTSTIQTADINDLRTDPAIQVAGASITRDLTNEAGTTLLDEDAGTVGDGTVDTGGLQNDAVTSAKIGADQVGSGQIATDAVTAAEIDLSISPTWTGEHTFQATSFTGDIDFQEGSSLIHDRDEVTADTVTDGSAYYLVDTDAAGGAVTVTLASDDAEEGREVNIKRDGASDVVIDTEGSETIDGGGTFRLDYDQASITLVYNNPDSDWEVW